MIETKFKQTDLGLIPEDWNLLPLKNVTSNMSDGPFGSNLKVSDYTTKKEVRIIQLSNIGDNGWNDSNIKYTTFEHAKKIHRCCVFKDTLVIAKMMPAGRAIITPKTEKLFILSSDVIKVIVNDNVDKNYILYATKNDLYIKQIEENTQGSTRARTSITKLRQISLAFPSYIEQTRIASALTSVDNLITSISALIEKKKQIKQGAMQELLSGKKRLKGYTEPWVEYSLGDLLDYEQPTNYLVQSTEYEESGTPVLTAGKSLLLGYTNDKFGIFNELPVILFDDFTTASKFITYPFKVKSSAAKMLKLKNKKDNIRLIFEIMQVIDFPLTDHKRYWISQYSKIRVFLPSSQQEQSAIASVITSMDNEIIALEAKRDKYVAIKSGMMQQLLTGKIRLI